MVSDTGFRKFILGKLFVEKIVPGASKNWSYHTDLLVFCLKFKLSPVCEYLNYYYNITNDCWAIPEKSKQGGGVEDILFLNKNPWIFQVCHFNFRNSGQKKDFFTAENSVKLCYTPWKFQGQKPRLIKTQQSFTHRNSVKFFKTPRNCTSFSVEP